MPNYSIPYPKSAEPRLFTEVQLKGVFEKVDTTIMPTVLFRIGELFSRCCSD